MLWTSELLSRRPELAHGFTGREGGVSEGALSSLNLSLRAGELPERRDENWRRVRLALGLPQAAVALARQVHGAGVRAAWEAPGAAVAGVVDLGEADAVLARAPGSLCAVLVADCVPVLLAGPRTVAAVHAGWRGTALGIAARAARQLAEHDGCAPSEVLAAIGPCIQACCYEVGEEVAGAIASASGIGVIRRDRPRPHVDLSEANRQQLLAAGLREVEALGLCTRCHGAFFSNRGDGPDGGRQAGIIGWR